MLCLNALKSLFPIYRDSTFSVEILGVGFSVTYPYSLFKVEAEISSPDSCSTTTDSASKSADVWSRLP